MKQWCCVSLPYRLPIKINTGDYARINLTVNIEINFTCAITEILETVNIDPLTMHVVEVDDQDTIISEDISHQFNPEDNNPASEIKGTLALFLSGRTPAGTTRRFHIYFGKQETDCATTNPTQYITLTDNVIHEGQESYKIHTPNATYIYHKFGAGFASMLDLEGYDWISYHPGGGSDGKYRGIPNLVYPEGYFHPGNDGCVSRVLCQGPLKVTIHSTSKDDLWSCTWDITPGYATLTVNKVAQPYWFLYEGTPGGQLDEEEDFIVRSSGEITPASERWDGAIAEPEWLYFGTRSLSRVLYLIHHEADTAIDSYWPMEHNMTVFGFGRMDLNKFMHLAPAHFTIGFAEKNDFSSVSEIIDSAYRPVNVKVGHCQTTAT